MRKIPTIMEHVSFFWVGLFALFALGDKTIWHMPQTALCLGAFFLYLVMNIRSKFRCVNSLALVIAGIAMSLFWYEMALSSLADSTGPILIFTAPVLVIWCLRTVAVYSNRITVLSFAWMVPLIVGMVVFLPTEPVRDSYLSNQDPGAARHSIRALIAMLTIILAAGMLAIDRRAAANKAIAPGVNSASLR